MTTVSTKTLLCFEVRVRVRILELGLAEIRFRSNVFSSKSSRTADYGWKLNVDTIYVVFLYSI